MTATGILEQLHVSGLTITITTDGTGLLVSPREAITPELAALIRANKQALLDTLWHPARAEALCAQLVTEGVAVFGVTGESQLQTVWQQAANAMDDAVEEQDMAALLRAVAAWQTAQDIWTDAHFPPVDTASASAQLGALNATVGAIGQQVLA